MDAVKYFKEKARMVKANTNGKCFISCKDCGLNYTKTGKPISCGCFEMAYSEEAVAIVKNWSEEHKLKTRAEVFFERFPDARREEDGSPRVCAKTIGLTNSCPEYSCYGCWNQPAPDKYQEWGDK